MKIKNDKYYTSDELGKYCVEKTKEIVGQNNIVEYLEPSAGNGVFLNHLDKPYLAYDILPEDDRIAKQDYLELDLEYKAGRCVIGNPPFGDRYNDLISKFYRKSIQLGDYIAFILPIRQYNNDMLLYEFDLVYSENLGVKQYSNIDIMCCFNIYKRPSNGLNSKPNHKLNCIKIEEHHRTRNKLMNKYDYRFCSFGSALGKECGADAYCKEYCLTIEEKFRDEVIELLRSTDFKKEFPSVSSPYVGKWQIYKYIKKNIKNIF